MEVIETNVLKISEIESQYPNQWIVLGNPVFDGMDVFEGVVIAHHTDKRISRTLSKKANWRMLGSNSVSVTMFYILK